MADIFDVVADATRRDILRVLLDRTAAAPGPDEGVSVSEIVAALELSQPTVSKHLKVLREAGLVSAREEGQRRYYRLNAGPLGVVEDWLLPFVQSIPQGGIGTGGLPSEAKDFASNVGRVFADTSHRVSSVVERASRLRRRD